MGFQHSAGGLNTCRGFERLGGWAVGMGDWLLCWDEMEADWMQMRIPVWCWMGIRSEDGQCGGGTGMGVEGMLASLRVSMGAVMGAA